MFLSGCCLTILEYWADDNLSLSSLLDLIRMTFVMWGVLRFSVFIGDYINYLRGYYNKPYFESAIKLNLGEYCMIPNTSISAYMVRDKKGDFKIFDYDGGIIISLFMKQRGVGEYVNLRFEYDSLNDNHKRISVFRPVGSMRKQLRRKWLSQYIVDLNDPDWEEKLAHTLKENEALLYPGKKTETKHQPTNTQDDHK